MDVYFAASPGISAGSFEPPGVDAAAADDPPKSCLLEYRPFLGESTNATTALYHIKHPDDKVSIQVSLFVASPPRISYVLAWSTRTYFAQEPFIHCTHGGLILLSMAVAVRTKLPSSCQYYIYQPSVPSLQLVPQPKDRRLADESCGIGLLSDGSGGYHVAVLTTQGGGDLELFLFSSDTGTWTFKKPPLVSLDKDRAADFVPDKVITVGGGVMAFVDLWNGILVGDVLQGGGSPEFHHIPLPFGDPRRPCMDSYRLMPRDVTIDIVSAAGEDAILRIRLAEVICPTDLSAWVATTWITTTAATSPWGQHDEWRMDSLLQARHLLVGDGVSVAELLPPPDEADLDPLDLGYLFVDRPLLSLHQDNFVYFLAKRRYRDSQVFVIAVDMVEKKLQVVHPLQKRTTRFFSSTVSSHLNN